MLKIHSDGFKFSYTDLASDYDRLWDHHFERAESDDEKRAFLNSARAFVEDAYYAKGAYAAIVRDLQSGAALVSEWRENKRVIKCINHLRAVDEREILKRLLRSAIANRVRKYWEYQNNANNAEWGEAHRLAASDEKKMAFDDLEFVIGLMNELGETEEAARYVAEKALLAENKRNLVKTKPDPRDMDEELFWEVIEVGQDLESVHEQVSAITEKLVTFNSRNIQRFRKILDEKLRAAYHWDVWALAYLARGGCSDDAFEYFRAWLILQGQAIYSRALSDPTQILDNVPQGLGTQSEMLLYAADDAYTARTGNVLKPVKSKQPSQPVGQPWDENTIAKIYPKIARHYARD